MSRSCLLVLFTCVNYYVAGYYDFRVARIPYFEYNIVPEMLSVAPTGYIGVLYNGTSVQKGTVLSSTEVQDRPVVIWDLDFNYSYIIAMVDLDVPSRESPTSREYLHWLVVNIPGFDLEDGDFIDEGYTIAKYVGPTPQENTGLHRYVFLVYQQTMEIMYDEPSITRLAENRSFFSIEAFANKYRLGQPVAGNFFQSKYDTNVPNLNKDEDEGEDEDEDEDEDKGED